MKKILFLTTFVVFIFTPTSVSADIIINEFIPNPEGKDEENEWVVLWDHRWRGVLCI